MHIFCIVQFTNQGQDAIGTRPAPMHKYHRCISIFRLLSGHNRFFLLMRPLYWMVTVSYIHSVKISSRSEERRVGKECRWRWGQETADKNEEGTRNIGRKGLSR